MSDFTQEQLAALAISTRDLRFYIDEAQRETEPLLRDFHTARVRHAVRRVAETAAGIDPDRLAMEGLHGKRYERAACHPCGTVLFPVTHVFPDGGPWAWGWISMTPPSPGGMALLSWAILDGQGVVLVRGEEHEVGCGSRQQMIRRGLDVIRRHGGRRVWPRSRVWELQP